MPTHHPGNHKDPQGPLVKHRMRMLSCSGQPAALAFLRAGEFIVAQTSDFNPQSSMCLCDIAVDSRQNPLEQSKTDPFCNGVTIYLEQTQADICPVATVLAYVAVWPAVPGPLFVFRDGSYLTHDRLVTVVRQALRAARVDTQRYSGHSFRIGAATTAGLVGIVDSVIKMLGRWETSAYQRYLCTPRETQSAISARLVGHQAGHP